MDVSEIRQRVRAIAKAAHDPEMAHRAEDALYKDVLRAIAAGSLDADVLAREALSATKIRFSRWYA